jgi:glyoxylase-like metal-dependent hydrolase (beta-lactamase superfamily II)
MGTRAGEIGGGDLEDWFEVTEVEPGLWALREPRHVEEVISYLVQGERSAALIDTGMGIADIRKVATSLTGTPIQVVNTHSHYDHVGDDHRFASVAVHAKEREAVERGVGGERLAALVGEATFNGPAPEGFSAQDYRIRPAKVSRNLAGGDVIGLGSVELRVLHTPGHSPGSICLWEPSKKWLFSGDTVYRGPLYAQLPHSNFGDYLESLQRLSELAPLVRMVLPSHGETPLAPALIYDMAKGFQRISDGELEYRNAESPEFGTIRIYQFEDFAVYLPEADFSA